MGYYHTCPYCGANLDPGERCDCERGEKPSGKHHSEKAAPVRLNWPTSFRPTATVLNQAALRATGRNRT